MPGLSIDDPYTLKTCVERPFAPDSEVEAVLNAASAAARDFSTSTVEERQALCTAAMEAMLADETRITGDITRMMGKPVRQAKGELRTMAERARQMIAIAGDSLADTVVEGREGYERRIERVPLGVVFNMPAWNYPLLTCVNAVVPALLAGNAVVLKHSTRTALCGEHFADAFDKAGAPAGLFRALHCDHATAARVARDDRVDYVAFTGSIGGGHAVYRAVASGHFTDAGLELGGKDAAYIASDANIDEAVAGVIDGALYNSGQSCCGVERIYVHRDRYDGFVEAARAIVAAQRLGDPRGDVDMGPMAQPNACAFLEQQVASAKAAGANVVVGGSPTQIDGMGRFFESTLVIDVTHEMDLMKEESFGPIVAIMSVDDDEQALALMNDSDLGLTASVWTADRDRAARMGRQLQVGTVFMNQCDVLDPALPWTGVKDSGKGSTLSALGFNHLTRPRSINFRLS
jgi:acyl-CoA reductase-like NAD-dependent aldehyde dehydrogenase